METYAAEDNSTRRNLTLLCNLESDNGGDLAFRRIVERANEAQRSLEIRMAVWRNDATGNELGRAVLDAAERGVDVRIVKDRSSIRWERTQGNRKSFFHTQQSLGARIRHALTGSSQTSGRDRFDHSLGDAIRNHPNVSLTWADNANTRSYNFDERIMILGSGCVEDGRARRCDYMVEITGEESLQRLSERATGAAEFDPERNLEFLINRPEADKPAFEIKKQILRAIAEAQHAVYVEIAAIGDPEVILRLIGAARHGVRVKILTSRRADNGASRNYRALKKLCDAVEIEVYLSDRPVHSKLMLFDWKKAILGSANLSAYSMEKAGELNVVVQGRSEFMRDLNAEVRRRLTEGERAESIRSLKLC